MRIFFALDCHGAQKGAGHKAHGTLAQGQIGVKRDLDAAWDAGSSSGGAIEALAHDLHRDHPH